MTGYAFLTVNIDDRLPPMPTTQKSCRIYRRTRPARSNKSVRTAPAISGNAMTRSIAIRRGQRSRATKAPGFGARWQL